MQNDRRIVLWFEVVVAVIAGALGVLTVFYADWIETVFGIDPDHHGGQLEWGVVGLLVVASLVSGRRAHAHMRRRAPTVSAENE
jgi:hypothetical protein